MIRRSHERTKGSRIRGRFGLAWLWVLGVSSAAHAEIPQSHWQIDVPLYLSANTVYAKSAAGTDVFGTLSATAEIEIWSHRSPWSGSVFIDHHSSADDRVDGTVDVGVLLQYRFDKWDSTAALIRSNSPYSPAVWFYAGRLRYRFAEQHKLGIQSGGSFSSSESLELAIGYYGKISRNLTVNVVAGSRINSGNTQIARAQLVWQIH